MEYPILISGRPAGTLKRSQEGLYTLFSARLEKRPALWRLWLPGPEPFCLGLFRPDRGGHSLCRRMSRLEMARLPEIKEAAALPDGQRPAPPGQPGHSEGAPSRPGKAAGKDSPAPPPNDRGAAPPQGEGAARGLLWHKNPDGSLYAHEGQRLILALPAALRRPCAGVRLARIGGREYMLFKY